MTRPDPNRIDAALLSQRRARAAIPADTPTHLRSRRAVMAYLRSASRPGSVCQMCAAPASDITETPWGPALVCTAHKMRERR
jgi:hypothetical protein